MKVRGGRMVNASGGSGTFTLSATGTSYTDWYDCTNLAILTTFLEASYANQSGATLDVSVEFKNEATGTAFDPSSAHTQLTDTGSNYKSHTVIGGKFRMKLVAGGAFGGSEVITATVDYYGHSN